MAFRSTGTGRFSASPIKSEFFYDELTPNLGVYGAYVVDKVQAVMREFGREMVAYAQENATWADRTGTARQGIEASVEEDKKKPSLYLYHTASYGLWLEIRWSGRFAIIMPTIEAKGPDLMKEIEKVI